MKISIGADHRGFELKEQMIKQFKNFEWVDEGCCSVERTDYPIYARKVCEAVLAGSVDAGVLICGSGIGMSIAANRYKKIYASLCWNEQVACLARQDDGANVLILPANFVSASEAIAIFNAWIVAKFKEGRYRSRLDLLDE